LGLYKNGQIIGAVGVSGDTSCADHNIAWRVRNNLQLDQMQGVGGVSGDPDRPDNLILDQYNGNKDGVTAGFEQPGCLNDASGDPRALPAVQH
jgi:hypothetical protein